MRAGRRSNLRRRPAKLAKKGKKTGMLAMMKRVAKQVLNRKSETKYVASQLYTDANVPSTLDIPGDLNTNLPPLLAGIESYQRNGSRISNVRGRTIYTFWLDNGTQSANNDIISSSFSS